MTLTRIALAAVALLLALAVWVYWPQTSNSGNTAKSAPPVRAPATSTAPLQQWRPGSTPALPPPDTPLKDIRETLIARALAGDAPAACRWATELERCPDTQFIKQQIKRTQEQAQNEHALPFMRERASQDVTRLQERLTTQERICEGFQPAEAKVAWKFLLAAADAGHIPSMIHFAEGFAMRPHMIPSRSEAAEAWTVHRDRAAQFLSRAVEAGDPRAVFISALAYERGEWFGEPLLTMDRKLALAHWQALRAVSTPAYASTLDERIRKLSEDPTLDAKDVAYVQKVADEVSAKLRAAHAKDVDYKSGWRGGGRHNHCD